ncbi:MAG: sigma-70 family RNA polymerase sigma factor [Planctomycetota bacterium]
MNRWSEERAVDGHIDIDDLNSLVPAIRRGDTAAFRDLVTALAGPLTRYAEAITGDPGSAADIVQDAMVCVYHGRRNVDPQRSLRGLCFRTARNLARNHVRDEHLRRHREREADVMRRKNEPEARPDAMATRAWDLAQRLPEAMREVIELRFAFGLARAEVADALGIPEGTVATRQRQALNALRQNMLASHMAVGAAITMAQLTDALRRAGESHAAASAAPAHAAIMAGIRSAQMKSIKIITAAIAAIVLLLGAAVAGLPGATPTTVRQDTPPARNSLALGPVPPINVTSTHHVEPTNEPALPAADTNRAEPAASNVPPTNREPEAPPVTNNAAPAMPQPVPDPIDDPAEVKRDDEPRTPTGVAPTLTCGSDACIPAGVVWRRDVKTTGTPAPTLTADPLPAWLRLDGSTLIGTPSLADVGTQEIVLIASNGVGRDAEQRIVLLVGTPPGITSQPGRRATVGKRYEYNVVLTGTPEPTLTGDDLPDWLTITGNVLSGVPPIDVVSPVHVQLVASNGIEPDASQAFDIDVECGPRFLNEPPTTAVGGQRYEWNIEVAGTPMPTVSVVGKLPDWLILDGNQLWGVPRNGDKGRARIRLAASNGVGNKALLDFNIVVSEGERIEDMPWSLSEARAFIVVGLKWEMRRHMLDSMVTPPESYEVMAVDSLGYTLKHSYPRSVTPTSVTWGEQELTCTWANNVVDRITSDRDTATRAKPRLDVLGKKRNCVQVTLAHAGGSPGSQELKHRVYCADFPIGYIEERRENTTPQFGTELVIRWQLESLTRP